MINIFPLFSEYKYILQHIILVYRYSVLNKLNHFSPFKVTQDII